MSATEPVNFRAPEELVKALKDRAAREGATVTDLLIRYARQGLDAERLGIDIAEILRGGKPPMTEDQVKGLVQRAVAETVKPFQKELEALRKERTEDRQMIRALMKKLGIELEEPGPAGK